MPQAVVGVWGLKGFKIKAPPVLNLGSSPLGVTSLSSPVFCIRTFLQGLLMPHLLQEALPDTLALPACQLFGLDPVVLFYTNLEGLSVCRVSGNHDNMGCFLVAMETCELVLRLVKQNGWAGFSHLIREM